MLHPLAYYSIHLLIWMWTQCTQRNHELGSESCQWFELIFLVGGKLEIIFNLA